MNTILLIAVLGQWTPAGWFANPTQVKPAPPPPPIAKPAPTPPPSAPNSLPAPPSAPVTTPVAAVGLVPQRWQLKDDTGWTWFNDDRDYLKAFVEGLNEARRQERARAAQVAQRQVRYRQVCDQFGCRWEAYYP